MKKLTLYTLLILFNYKTYSQSAPTPDGSTFTHEKNYKWGVGVQVNSVEGFSQYEKSLFDYSSYSILEFEWKNNSYSSGVRGIYRLNENTFLNCQAGTTQINLSSNSDSRTGSSAVPGAYTLGNSQITEARYYCSPRIGWEMRKSKFGFNGGFAILFTSYSDYKLEGHGNDYDANNTMVAYYKFHRTASGGYTTGTGAFAGFNVYLFKHISIGADVSSALIYYKLGSTITTTYEQIYPTGVPSNTYSFFYSRKGFEYSGEKLSFNIIYLF